MIVNHFDWLRRKKHLKNRNLSLRITAEETGLSYPIVQNFISGDVERVYLSTLETLGKYFGVKSESELIEFATDAQSTSRLN